MILTNSEMKLATMRGLLLLLLTFLHQDNALPVETHENLLQNQTCPCQTRSCLKAAQTILSNMDLDQDPCVDFYRFACGGFEERFSDLNVDVNVDKQLDKQMKRTLKKLLTSDNIEKEPKVFWKARDYYSSCLKAKSTPKKQLKGLKQILDEFGGWPVLKGHAWDVPNFSWQDVTAKLYSEGLDIASILGVDIYYDYYRSLTNNKRVIQIREPSKLRNSSIVQDAYRKLIEDVATHLGAPQELLKQEVEDLMKFYENFSKILTKKEQKSTSMFSINSVVTVGDLYKISNEVDWLKYLLQIFPISIDVNTKIYLRIDETKLSNLIAFLMKTPSRVLANFILWKVVYDQISKLQDPKMMEMKINYTKTVFVDYMPMEKEQQWIVCLRDLNALLKPALTALYGRYYFKHEHKMELLQIFEMIRKSTETLVEKADWMNDSTKQQLKLKVSNFEIAMGYPDDLMDDEILDKYYESLTISKNEYLLNKLHLIKFVHRLNSQETQPDAPQTHWREIKNLLENNAYYDSNVVAFPVSHLKGIYFAPNRLQALNFGSLGSVFGHELFHGVNEFGLNNIMDIPDWWTPEDMKAFESQSTCTVKQYDKYQIQTNITVNGHNTLNENLSDNSGLKVAYMAYRKWIEANGEEPYLASLPYFNGKQLFWMAYANAWCASAYDISNLESGSFQYYTPNNYRVIGSIHNLEEFAKDFDCPSGSPMNPSDKCNVW
uniref:Neprilysin n=1 Tax=Hemiscolopendra marginata TaxID=943146 RepID=A0A646QFK0_9MYRI